MTVKNAIRDHIYSFVSHHPSGEVPLAFLRCRLCGRNGVCSPSAFYRHLDQLEKIGVIETYGVAGGIRVRRTGVPN